MNLNTLISSPETAGDAVSSTSPRPEKLLVVDDEFMNRDLMSRRLRHAGYLVETAVDGAEALRMIDEQAFDLLLLDIMMPGMSGLELVKTLRARHSASVLPVIMVSALNESSLIVEALGLGANDYVTKPVDFAVAIARVKAHLARKKADNSLRESFDSLTGLPNRILLTEKLSAALEQDRCGRRDIFAVLFIDLDGFKIINDSLGHLAGDQLLQAVARRLQEAVRADNPVGRDEIIRFGGDEFVALLRDLTDAREAVVVAERILERINRPFVLENREVFVSASIGIAMSDRGYKAPADMIRDADTAMYSAKASGRSAVRSFDESMRTEALERLELQNDLSKALANRELVLFYQPKVHMDTGRCYGFEALVRWRHPRHGLISPLRFISIAEETGLINSIGLWVLRHTCLQLKDWESRFPAASQLQMGVNVSVKQLETPGFAESVLSVLNETGVSPANLQLEMTESVVLMETQEMLAVLGQLKGLGVSLSVDDFGTGYSSLNRLDRYPFDNIKIDRSFILRLDRDERSAQVVKGILTLGRSLKIDVIAEGIERRSQVDQLLTYGCRHGQGHFYSQPVPPEEAEGILARDSVRASPTELQVTLHKD